MNDLLKTAINAHGGLDNWRKYFKVSAHLSVGGILWGAKGHEGSISEIDVTVDLLEQRTSHIPNEEWHTAYSPNRIAIESGKGEVIEELYDPRTSFKGHTWETQWSLPQLAYFTGYAMWNYMNTPFQFARPGFEIREIDPWKENDEAWRRLQVKWPGHIHTHSPEQTIYIDKEGLIRRVDYELEISGNIPAAHYLYDYIEVGGIKLATKRIVYPLGENNRANLDGPVVVSIDLTSIKFS